MDVGNHSIARLSDFIPPETADDALLLVALAGLGALAFLVVAGLVEAARAFHGWMRSYSDEPKGGR